MSDSRRRRVDMSPEAIDRRLREVASLYRLGISIATARRLGPKHELERQRAARQARSGRPT